MGRKEILVTSKQLNWKTTSNNPVRPQTKIVSVKFKQTLTLTLTIFCGEKVEKRVCDKNDIKHKLKTQVNKTKQYLQSTVVTIVHCNTVLVVVSPVLPQLAVLYCANSPDCS